MLNSSSTVARRHTNYKQYQATAKDAGANDTRAKDTRAKSAGFDIYPSMQLAVIAIGCFLAICFSLINTNLPIYIQVTLLLITAFILDKFIMTHALHTHANSVQRLRCLQLGQWQITTMTKQYLVALQHDTVNTHIFSALHFSGEKKLWLLLDRHTLDSNSYRKISLCVNNKSTIKI